MVFMDLQKKSNKKWNVQILRPKRSVHRLLGTIFFLAVLFCTRYVFSDV